MASGSLSRLLLQLDLDKTDIHLTLTDYLGPWISGLISFFVLVFASWCVGEGGEILGKKYDASIIGGLLIAWLNTAPETIFFVTALQSDNPRFAVGAVSGSTIGTIFFIIRLICQLYRPLRWELAIILGHKLVRLGTFIYSQLYGRS